MSLHRISCCLPMILVISTVAFAEAEKLPIDKEKQQADPQRILEEKLDQKRDFEFRRTSLKDALAEISQKSKIPIAIDAEGLKFEGLTQNISQTLALKDFTIREALCLILEGRGNQSLARNPTTLIVIYDAKTQGLILSTRRSAEGKKLPVYPLKTLTLEEKLQQKIDVSFRKTALQDAFAYIATQSGIPIVVDGEALKAVGFTKNMNQEMNLGTVTVQEAILGLMKGKGHSIIKSNPETLVMIYNEQTRGFTVSAVPYATDKGLKPYEFK
jgi:hypothetical protein